MPSSPACPVGRADRRESICFRKIPNNPAERKGMTVPNSTYIIAKVIVLFFQSSKSPTEEYLWNIAFHFRHLELSTLAHFNLSSSFEQIT